MKMTIPYEESGSRVRVVRKDRCRVLEGTKDSEVRRQSYERKGKSRQWGEIP